MSVRKEDIVPNGGLITLDPLTIADDTGYTYALPNAAVGGKNLPYRGYILAVYGNTDWHVSTNNSQDQTKSVPFPAGQVVYLPVNGQSALWFMRATGSGSLTLRFLLLPRTAGPVAD